MFYDNLFVFIFAIFETSTLTTLYRHVSIMISPMKKVTDEHEEKANPNDKQKIMQNLPYSVKGDYDERAYIRFLITSLYLGFVIPRELLGC